MTKKPTHPEEKSGVSYWLLVFSGPRQAQPSFYKDYELTTIYAFPLLRAEGGSEMV
jgi:hypothetical protein